MKQSGTSYGSFASALALALLAAVQQAPAQKPAKLSHPAITLKDDAGRNVLESGKAISTRKSCGDCHDYDFITNSFHFQQGKAEMSRDYLKAHGAAPFNSSPGMFGKFSLIPNRQLTHANVTDPLDVDMSQPEWITKCGACHTGGGISEYDLKGRRFLTPDAKPSGPLDPSYTIRDRDTGEVMAWDWQKSGITEGDCFLCHVPNSNRGARREKVTSGDFRWANNATLSDTGILTARPDGSFAYNRAAFNADGTVKAEAINLSSPTLENCAQCHGFTARNATTIQPIQFADIFRGTEKSGWVFNGAKISDTVSPKIVGKEKMNYPWDAHAAKNMICTDCHFAPNNPGSMIQEDAKKNLRYKPASEDLRDYLMRPDHNFARGNIPPETVNMAAHDTMRDCGDCHDATKGHDFLPYKSRHFEAMACETCHIPAVHFWAYRSDDWSVLMDTGTSRITFRGIDGSIVDSESEISGYKPAYIATTDKNGRKKIRPTNLITGVYWFDKGKNRPVYTWQVQQAFFGEHSGEDWTYRPEVVKVFGDEEGFIDEPQAVYDKPEKIALVKELLKKYSGVENAELRIDITPWAMSHGIVGKDQAVKDCSSCHSGNSMLHNPLDLNSYLPRGVPIVYAGKQAAVVNFEGREPTFNNRPLLASFYIIGDSREPWVEWLGWLSIAGAMLFALTHGALRLLGGRK